MAEETKEKGEKTEEKVAEKAGKEGKKPKEKAPEKEVKKEAPKVDSKIKTIVRVAATDLNGDLPVERAIRGVKGVGFSLSKAVVKILGLEKKKLTDLSKEERERLEAVIKEPGKAGIPAWMTNDNGEHYVSAGLDLKVKKDIDFMRMIKSYKGVRHQLGLPVRGQRTRGSFRKGTKVGVTKKKEQPARTDKKEKK
jgi:small subunit ribosomal protein S13